MPTREEEYRVGRRSRWGRRYVLFAEVRTIFIKVSGIGVGGNVAMKGSVLCIESPSLRQVTELKESLRGSSDF